MSTKPNFNCEICNTPVYRNPKNKPIHITCSDECRGILTRSLRGKYVICDNCGISFYKKNSRISNKNFCCSLCSKEYRKILLSDDEIINLFIKGLYDHEIAVISKCSREAITKIINAHGYINRRSKINDIELRCRISATNSGKRTGINNHKFKGKGSFTSMARGLFNSISKLYMLKNDYTCKVCNKRGGNLHTHHIKPLALIIDEFISKNPDITTETFSQQILLYDDFINETNLVLVCVKCHRNIHCNDNPELSPYRWKSATTIESINQNEVNRFD